MNERKKGRQGEKNEKEERFECEGCKYGLRLCVYTVNNNNNN